MLNRCEDGFQGNTRFLRQLGSCRCFSLGILHGNGDGSYIFTDAANNAPNHTGLVLGPLSQSTDVGCDCAKTFPILTCHGRLNSGIQRQAIRLVCDTGNDFDDVIDLTRTVTERLHLCRGFLHVFLDTSHTFDSLLHCFASALRTLTSITGHCRKDSRAVSHLVA